MRVVYEALPSSCMAEMFVGKLEGNAGKDRSQRSNFLFDQYTESVTHLLTYSGRQKASL